MVSFAVTPGEARTIGKIAKRAEEVDRDVNYQWAQSLSDWQMDITACHANGNSLRLDDLLGADDFNFIHDAFGIRKNIDRTTGKLMNFFSPRFSARTQAEAA